MTPRVRICSIDIENIKNVLGGPIAMPHRVAGFNPDEGELLGIYGQNGTGKTAVVNALSLVQNLICGDGLQKVAAALMTYGKPTATISILFSVEGKSRSFDVRYSVTLERDGENVHIRRETLSAKSIEPNARYNTIVEFKEDGAPATDDIAPQSTLSKVLEHCTKQDILISKVLANQESRSYIFNDRMLELLLLLEDEHAGILKAVRQFAEHRLYIVTHGKSGMVNLGLQPIPFARANQTGPTIGVCVVNLNEPGIIPMNAYRDFQRTLEQINSVLCKIIPGLTLEARELGSELKTADIEQMRFELLAVRGDIRIPLKLESDGIKKIIAILLLWITVSNTPGTCLVVDELDASIFEYLLGELLSVWREHARGQLIFTAHNLHPLEVLDKRSVVFTTIDPHHRFIRLKNIKSTNNLRDVYLRSIFIGGQEFELYDETNKTEIARAIRRCAAPRK
ncbi:MAG: hypothetical protein MJ058_02260 [Akkermansia sp.]|nr:hypothetical protein [Akkermansia sp.]